MVVKNNNIWRDIFCQYWMTVVQICSKHIWLTDSFCSKLVSARSSCSVWFYPFFYYYYAVQVLSSHCTVSPLGVVTIYSAKIYLLY